MKADLVKFRKELSNAILAMDTLIARSETDEEETWWLEIQEILQEAANKIDDDELKRRDKAVEALIEKFESSTKKLSDAHERAKALAKNMQDIAKVVAAISKLMSSLK